VVGVHLDVQRAHDLGKQAPLLDGEIVSGFRYRTIAVVVEPARLVEQVLVEGSPEVDVEQLHPATDGQHGHVLIERGTDHRELETVPSLAHVVRAGMPLATVQLGVDVSTPAQHESGGSLEMGGVVGIELGMELDVVGDLLRGELLERGQDLDRTSGLRNRVDVGERQPSPALTPLTEDGDPSVVRRGIQFSQLNLSSRSARAPG
jgi:hypothetical protein